MPIRKNFKTLEEAIADWKANFGKGGEGAHKRDTVIDFCKKAKSFKQAVERACASKRENGKMFAHQVKVREIDRQNFCIEILANGVAQRVKTFDEMHDLLEQIALDVHGIGPVTIYDVAVRIAAYRGIKVTSLYLHAGVRIGWHRLHGHRSPNVKRIPRNQLPKALQVLDTDSIEDFLCGYRESLKSWLKEA